MQDQKGREMGKLKWVLAVVFAGSLFVAMNASAGDMSYCAHLEDDWGSNCGSSDSLQMKVKNNCGRDIYVQMCIERKDGKWSCGVNSSLHPGQTDQGFWTCHSTGRYKWAACSGGREECHFPNPH
jgi:hypothetical protein